MNTQGGMNTQKTQAKKKIKSHRTAQQDNALIAEHQSGFRKQHSTITAAMKVVNDIITALDKRQSCAVLFTDLSKAFDTVDHVLLFQSLLKLGLTEHTVGWFSNYLTDRSQCVKVNDL